jgi:hypothetical protein
MDFHKEQQTRIDKNRGEIGILAYERRKLALDRDVIDERIKDIDRIIGEKEAIVYAAEQAQRDFNTYLAVKEGAVTLEQIKEGVEKGGP